MTAISPRNLDPVAPRTSGEPALWRPLEVMLRPLDEVRRWSWGLSAKTAFGRACLRDRGLRLTTLAVGHIVVAAVLTVIAPVWLLLLGPIVLGVPHVASDIRYLLINPPLPLGRRGLVLLLGPLLAMTGLRVAAAFGAPYRAELEIVLGAAAMLGGVAIARVAMRRKLVMGVVLVALAGLALTASYDVLLAIAHGHNLIAFGLWLWLFRGETSFKGLGLIVGSYVAVVVVLLSGAFDGAMTAHAMGSDVGRFGLVEMTQTLTPGMDFVWGLRLIAVYAFAQAMHYVVWLRLIPQRMDVRTAPPTVRRSVQRLRVDFGRLGFAVLVLSSVLVPIAALCFDASDVRSLYLLAALAHGWIELAIIAALVTRGRAGSNQFREQRSVASGEQPMK